MRPLPPSSSSSQPAQKMTLENVSRSSTFSANAPSSSATIRPPPTSSNSGNFLITVVIESLAESFALAEKSGVPRATLLDVLTSSLFNAPIYKNYGGMIAADIYEPVGFRMPLGFKDNRLLINHAEEMSVPMPIASLVHDRFLAALATDLKDADWSAIARVVLRNAGLDKQL
jgi:hypothetical protein